MGRLRRGESLIDKLLKNGGSVFPPLPPTKELYPRATRRKRAPLPPIENLNSYCTKQPTRENAESNVASPTKKKQKKVSSLTGSLSKNESDNVLEDVNESSDNVLEDVNESGYRNESDNVLEDVNESGYRNESDNVLEDVNASGYKNDSDNESDNVLEDVNESGLLLRLHHFPNMKPKNKSSLRLSQKYASKAEAIRNALISDLMSQEYLDVESMVDKANEAFASLSSLHNDFGDLYDAVRAFIAHHCQLSEAKKKRESLQEMIARRNNLLARSNGKAKALSSCQTALNDAKENFILLMDRFEETRALLNELEEKLAQGGVEIDALKEEHDKLKEAFEASKAEHEKVADEVKEKQKIVEQINSRCDNARAGIDKTKALLSSLC